MPASTRKTSLPVSPDSLTVARTLRPWAAGRVLVTAKGDARSKRAEQRAGAGDASGRPCGTNAAAATASSRTHSAEPPTAIEGRSIGALVFFFLQRGEARVTACPATLCGPSLACAPECPSPLCPPSSVPLPARGRGTDLGLSPWRWRGTRVPGMSAKTGKPAVHIESMASESVPLLATDTAQPEFNDGFRCASRCARRGAQALMCAEGRWARAQARKPSRARKTRMKGNDESTLV